MQWSYKREAQGLPSTMGIRHRLPSTGIWGLALANRTSEGNIRGHKAREAWCSEISQTAESRDAAIAQKEPSCGGKIIHDSNFRASPCDAVSQLYTRMSLQAFYVI